MYDYTAVSHIWYNQNDDNKYLTWITDVTYRWLGLPICHVSWSNSASPQHHTAVCVYNVHVLSIDPPADLVFSTVWNCGLCIGTIMILMIIPPMSEKELGLCLCGVNGCPHGVWIITKAMLKITPSPKLYKVLSTQIWHSQVKHFDQ